jgi:hypothetical protein
MRRGKPGGSFVREGARGVVRKLNFPNNFTAIILYICTNFQKIILCEVRRDSTAFPAPFPKPALGVFFKFL